jgi:hypothetical protein
MLLALLVVAGVWRAVMAVALPVIARDGAVFCAYARALDTQGWAYLRTPEARQHPLFPVLILVVRRAAGGLGAPDTPMTWQRSGQIVSWTAGMAVIVLTGLLTTRFIRRLQLPVHEQGTVLLAMLLAAVLDHNVWLSADVMSDQVHLALYLAAACLLLKLESASTALGVGVLAGLAFLTRPEGLMPVIGGLAVLATQRKRTAWRLLSGRAVLLLLGFVVCALPYWLAVGRLSAKKDPHDWLPREDAAAVRNCTTVVNRAPAADEDGDASPGTALARLTTVDLRGYQVAPFALYKLLRAGRVIVVLLAVLPLVNLRRRLLGPELIGLSTCAAGHFALTLILLSHYGYLDPRHTLVIVMLLVPLAALFLGRVLHLLRQRGQTWLSVLVLTACVLPLAAYAARVPNRQDRFLADATRWLTGHDPDLSSKRLVGGSSTRRIAFYADMRWEQWFEDPNDAATLRAQLLSGGPGYFAIEVDPAGSRDRGSERSGNRALVEHLLGDAEIAAHMRLVHTETGPDGSQLQLFELLPAPVPPP